MSELHETLQKPSDTTLSNTGKKCSQTVLENYTPSKMLRDFTMPGTENTPTFTEMEPLGLVLLGLLFWFFS